MACRLEFDEALVETVPLSALPPDWTEEPPSRSTQDLGDRWVRESRSVVFEVPTGSRGDAETRRKDTWMASLPHGYG